MKSYHVFAIAMAFCLVLPALPCEAEIDRERMRQDLDIMEGILQNLHARRRPGWPESNESHTLGDCTSEIMGSYS